MARACIGLVAISLLAGCAPDEALVNTSDSPVEARAEAPAVGVEEPRIVPIPPIPAALHGCWDSIPPTEPDEPGGPHRLIVAATKIAEIGPNTGEKVGTADHVSRVSATSIEGRFSYPDAHGRATLATSLSVGPDDFDTAPGTLRRAEGDAGSTIYRRCP